MWARAQIVALRKAGHVLSKIVKIVKKPNGRPVTSSAVRKHGRRAKQTHIGVGSKVSLVGAACGTARRDSAWLGMARAASASAIVWLGSLRLG